MNAEFTEPTERTPAGWLAFAFAALLASSAIGFLLDQRLFTHLKPYRWGPRSDVSEQQLRPEERPAAQQQLLRTERTAGAIALSSLAAGLTLALCLAEAAKRRRTSALVMTPPGVVLGATAGALGGFAAVKLHQYFETGTGEEPTVMHAAMVQSAAWVCTGVGVSLAVWLVARDVRRLIDTLVSGALAGLLVGVLYAPIAATLFSDFRSDSLFPENGYFPPNAEFGRTGAFLFWAIFTCTVFAAVLGGISGRPAPQRRPTVVDAES
jgi:hypothetical protein